MNLRTTLAFLLALAVSPQVGLADDQVVSDLGDNGGADQLRAKISACQATNGGTITFSVAGTILLGSTLPNINGTVTIDGGNGVVLSGNNATRVFFIDPSGKFVLKNITVRDASWGSGDGAGMRNNGGTVTIQNCKFLNNRTTSTWSGGAIMTLGPMTISDTEFGMNQGSAGGALYPRFGNAAVTIANCNFHDNQAVNTSGSGWGGAILVWDGAVVRASQSSFTTNSATSGGGAVFVQGPSGFYVDQCSFASNNATDTFAEGGAVHVEGGGEFAQCSFTANYASRAGALFVASGTTLVRLSTFDTNWAAYGGAIRIEGGTLDLNRVTFDRNGYTDAGTKVTTGGGALSQSDGLIVANNVTISNSFASYGAALNRENGANPRAEFTNVTITGGVSVGSGAIELNGGTLSTTNVTITNNQASFFAAGVTVRRGVYTLRNTIVAKNLDQPNFQLIDTGVVTSLGFNLCDDESGATVLTNSGDKVGAQFDPMLRPLAANGGFTLTHLPLPGSPAIDSATETSAPTTDQRGVTRPQGSAYDIGAVEVQAAELVTPKSTLGNISTRLRVGTGDNVLIGGFIVTGTEPKKVILRAIGPSLSQVFPGTLVNPTLELYSGNTLLASNDDWQNQPAEDKQAVIDSTIPPSNDLESALVRTLPANGASYTAIVRGAGDGTGIGLVEVYDLDPEADSKLANISTRGLVQTGDHVLIAGMIIVGDANQKVILRAIGPSLPVAGKLDDPELELHDSNGGLLDANDNWVDSPNKQAIIDSTIPPTNDLEAAIVATLPSNDASYTAIVRGVNGTSGIAVVEVYALD